jgi:hypothetical protein
MRTVDHVVLPVQPHIGSLFAHLTMIAARRLVQQGKQEEQ